MYGRIEKGVLSWSVPGAYGRSAGQSRINLSSRPYALLNGWMGSPSKDNDLALRDDQEEEGMGPKKKNHKTKCFTCSGQGHLARDCPSTRCHYCGRQGHIAKTCGMGQVGSKHPGQLFVFCDKLVDRDAEWSDSKDHAPDHTHSSAPAAPPPQDAGNCHPTAGIVTQSECFVRRFIVPLSRARPDFSPSDLTDGRLDVACRCAVGCVCVCVCACVRVYCACVYVYAYMHVCMGVSAAGADISCALCWPHAANTE
jgi:hypothetical protein